MKILICILICFPMSVFGQFVTYDAAGNPIDGNGNLVEDSGVVELPVSGTEDPISVPDTDLDSSSDTGAQIIDPVVNESEKQAGALRSFQRQASNAQIISEIGQMAAGGFLAACISSWGTGAWACWAAGAAFAGSIAASKHADKMNRGAASLSSELSGSGDAGYSDEGLLSDQDLSTDPEILAGIATLKDQGFIINEDGTVTGPGGVTVSGSDLESAAGLAKVGVAAEDADSILGKINKIKTNAESSAKTKANVSTDTSGKKGRTVTAAGGSLGGGGGAVQGLDPEAVGGGGTSKANQSGRLTASEANKYKRNFLGTPIGIAGASVFGIVTKKYQKSDKKNTFFKREY